LFQPKLLK